MKKSCIECHFFANTGLQGVSNLYDEKTREAFKNRDPSFVQQLYPKCHKGVWGSGFKQRGSKEWFYEMFDRDRGDECFFWRFVPGMQFEAAEILQERDQKNKETSKQWKYTAIGLWIAGFGLVINVLFELIKLIIQKK